MSLTVSRDVLLATSTDTLKPYRARAQSWRADELTIVRTDLTDTTLSDLAAAAAAVENKPLGRVIDALIAARQGDIRTIPSLKAAPEIMTAFFQREMIDGWLYIRKDDGHLHPYLVTRVRIVEPRGDGRPSLSIDLIANDPITSRQDRGTRNLRHTIHFEAVDVARKKPHAVLESGNAYKETAALKADYLSRLAAFEEIVATGFAQQYRYSGTPFRSDDFRSRATRLEGRKIVHDLHHSELPSFVEFAETELLAEDAVASIPTITTIRVFDLGSHDSYDANAADLAEYEYDANLREKLILPADQTELLDILTTDIDTFTADVIEGKSAGNVILGKGIPGVGKTLTAEVYSELIQRPLYSIHSGALGVTADAIRKNLETVFKRAKRWDAVLLLDEADVFVLERGNDITQNAIVAEFLRTLEYFDGLLFMTTNRANNIDDAILSRCAAIIDYQVPGRADAAKVWEVQAANMGHPLKDALLEKLLDGFPTITPRDIKMLLRLALRVSAHRDEELSIEVFRRCAMFRGQHLVAAGSGTAAQTAAA